MGSTEPPGTKDQKSGDTCFVETSVQHCEGPARRALAAASVSNVVGGTDTSTCRQHKRCEGKTPLVSTLLARRYERDFFSHPSKVAMTRNSILRQENASLNLIAHGPRCPVTSYPLLGIAHKCSPPSASVSCASSDSCS